MNRDGVGTETFGERFHRCGANPTASELTRRRCAVLKTMSGLTTHRFLNAGPKLHSFESALAPALVDKEATIRSVSASIASGFAYDSRILGNPEGRMVPHRVCRLRFGGLCEKDDLLCKSETTAENLFEQTKAYKHLFPLLLRLQIPTTDLWELVFASEASFSQWF